MNNLHFSIMETLWILKKADLNSLGETNDKGILNIIELVPYIGIGLGSDLLLTSYKIEQRLNYINNRSKIISNIGNTIASLDA